MQIAKPAKPEIKRLAVTVAHLHGLAVRNGEHIGSQYEAKSLHGKPFKPAKKESKPDAA